MSLQIWLPLNGDLKNYGLAQLPNPVVNTFTYEAGKIGQCATGRVAWHSDDDILNNQWSVAVWIKSNAAFGSNNNIIFCKNISQSTDCQIYFSIVNGTALHVGVNGPASSLSQSFTFALNTWYHVATTYDGNTVALYINGELKKTGVVTTEFPSGRTNFSINGRSSNAAGTSTTGQLNSYRFNDFRLYNHALSAKEVEEIAKGLVLHYKFDSMTIPTNPNLLPDTNVSSLTKVVGPYNRYYESVNGGSYTATFETISDPPVAGINYGVHYKVNTASGFHGVTWYSGGLITVSAEPYTLSCYVKKVSSGSASIKFQYGKSPYVSTTIALVNDNAWHQYSWTFTPNTASDQAAASNTTRIYGAGLSTVGEAIICGWKLEKGEQATRWIEYNTVDEPKASLEDVSGYGHHATAIGTIAASHDSVRYNTSVIFNGSNCIKNTNFNLPGKIWTISCWYYKPTNPTAYEGIFCISKGNGADANKKIAAMPNTGRIWYKGESGSLSISQIGIDKWTFLTMTCDGTTVTVYQNGVSIGTFSASTEMTDCHDLVIGARSNAAGVTATAVHYTGEVSDFRVYATALSAAAIQELYNTSASIDRDGNIYAREFNNTNSSNRFQINHRGQMIPVDKFIERDEKLASITKNDDVLGGYFYEY